MSGEYRYLFGPVPSRRLGYSLGVDVIPYKTCSYDCIYCQLGRTTEKTVTRRGYVPVEEVARELERKLKEPGKIDYVTFSGSGEPTLHGGPEGADQDGQTSHGRAGGRSYERFPVVGR
jgi:wyosine [tRNA(Phe)-imidazoG37] synthetase (radical SAM superfamily)